MTFQLDNGTAFVGELTMELIGRSQVAQAYTTYHLQTNDLVEKQNRTLMVSDGRVDEPVQNLRRNDSNWHKQSVQELG